MEKITDIIKWDGMVDIGVSEYIILLNFFNNVVCKMIELDNITDYVDVDKDVHAKIAIEYEDLVTELHKLFDKYNFPYEKNFYFSVNWESIQRFIREIGKIKFNWSCEEVINEPINLIIKTKKEIEDKEKARRKELQRIVDDPTTSEEDRMLADLKLL